MRDHGSIGRRPGSRFWAWALALVILVLAILICLPALGMKRYAPQPLLEFLEHRGPGRQVK